MGKSKDKKRILREDMVTKLAERMEVTKVSVREVIKDFSVILDLAIEIMEEEEADIVRLGDIEVYTIDREARDYTNPKTKKLQRLNDKINVKMKYKKLKKRKKRK